MALVAPSRSRAEQPTEADRLFNRARALMEGNHFSEACPMLAESQKMAPAAGTALNLGLCYEKLGKTLSAYNAYFDAAALAEKTDPKRAAFARERVTALEPKLARVSITLTGGEGDAVVKRDKDVLDKSAFGQPQPVDPGEHVIEVSAKGKRAWRTTLQVVGDGADIGVRVPPLEDAGGSFAAAPAPSQSALAPLQWLGLGLGSLGLAAISAGTVLAFGAKSKSDEASAHCPGDVCDARGNALDQEAVARGNVATVFWIAGAAAVGGGVYLFFAGKPKPAASASAPVLDVGAGGAALRGAF